MRAQSRRRSAGSIVGTMWPEPMSTVYRTRGHVERPSWRESQAAAQVAQVVDAGGIDATLRLVDVSVLLGPRAECDFEWSLVVGGLEHEGHQPVQLLPRIQIRLRLDGFDVPHRRQLAEVGEQFRLVAGQPVEVVVEGSLRHREAFGKAVDPNRGSAELCEHGQAFVQPALLRRHFG